MNDVIADPLPLEVTDPMLAEHLRLIANRRHPAIRRLEFSAARNVYVLRDGRVAVKHHAERNDPCPCGSGRKYKRCCLDA